MPWISLAAWSHTDCPLRRKDGGPRTDEKKQGSFQLRGGFYARLIESCVLELLIACLDLVSILSSHEIIFSVENQTIKLR